MPPPRQVDVRAFQKNWNGRAGNEMYSCLRQCDIKVVVGCSEIGLSAVIDPRCRYCMSWSYVVDRVSEAILGRPLLNLLFAVLSSICVFH